MKKISKETVGEIFVGFDTLTCAAFPVLISYGAKIMPPILFASLGYFVSSVVIFLYLIFRGQLYLLKNKKIRKQSLILFVRVRFLVRLCGFFFPDTSRVRARPSFKHLCVCLTPQLRGVRLNRCALQERPR